MLSINGKGACQSVVEELCCQSVVEELCKQSLIKELCCLSMVKSFYMWTIFSYYKFFSI